MIFPFENLPLELQSYVVKWTDDVTYYRLSCVSSTMQAIVNHLLHERHQIQYYWDGKGLHLLWVYRLGGSYCIPKSMLWNSVGRLVEIAHYQSYLVVKIRVTAKYIQVDKSSSKIGWYHALIDNDEIVEHHMKSTQSWRSHTDIEYSIRPNGTCEEYRVKDGENNVRWYFECEDNGYKMWWARGTQMPDSQYIADLMQGHQLPQPPRLITGQCCTHREIIESYRAVPLMIDNFQLTEREYHIVHDQAMMALSLKGYSQSSSLNHSPVITGPSINKETGFFEIYSPPTGLPVIQPNIVYYFRDD